MGVVMSFQPNSRCRNFSVMSSLLLIHEGKKNIYWTWRIYPNPPNYEENKATKDFIYQNPKFPSSFFKTTLS